MKLNELSTLEDKQLAAISRNWQFIKEIDNPSEAVQMKAIRSHAEAIRWINYPTPKVIKIALNYQQLIDNKPVYNELVDRLFKNKPLEKREWLRRGDVMRTS